MSLQQLESRMSQIEARLEALSDQPRRSPSPPDSSQKSTSTGQLPSFGTVYQNSLAPMNIQPGQTPEGFTIRPTKNFGLGANIDEIVNRMSPEYGLDPNLVKAVIKAESDGNPMCRSHKGAMGLMQLMPDEVKAYGVKDPFDPEENIRGGMKQLQAKLKLYKGDVKLTLAAYNAGTGAVRKYGGVPPYKETHHYIDKISRLIGDGR
jgi:soluble lytic murein transglycosylase-like protein